MAWESESKVWSYISEGLGRHKLEGLLSPISAIWVDTRYRFDSMSTILEVHYQRRLFINPKPSEFP
jgi:hypothetical protein